MCRMIVFAGRCTRCEEAFTWDSLTQQLWCLEAKNEDAFGQCRRGVQVEQHAFDQECERCEEEDEGVEVGDDYFGGAVEWAGGASTGHYGGGGSAAGGGGGSTATASGSSKREGKAEEEGRKRKKQKM